MDCYSLNRLYDRSVFFYYIEARLKCTYIVYTFFNEIPSDDSGFNCLRCWNCLESRLSDTLMRFVDAVNN